jgi:MOSC domain-containing protein YiiM
VFAGFRGVPDLSTRFIAAGRPGSYLAVEPRQAGDRVRVLDRPSHRVTVAGVLAAMTGDRELVPHVATRDQLGGAGRHRLERTLRRSVP